MNNVSIFIGAVTVALSLVSVWIAFSTYLHQKEISYPRIRIKMLNSYRNSNILDRCLFFSKEDKMVFLIVKVNITNFSQTSGMINNFKLKYSLTKKINNLSEKEIEKLTKNAQNFIQKCTKVNSKIIYDKEIFNSFENKIVSLVFKLPPECSLFGTKKKMLKLMCNGYDYTTQTLSKRFYISARNYADIYNPKEILLAVRKKHNEELKERERLEEEKIKKVLETIKNLREN